MGAMVGIRWMEQFRQNFKGAVFINTSASNLSAMTERLTPRTFLWGVPTLLSDSVSREPYILKLVSNSLARREQALKSWISIQRKSPVSRQTMFNQLLAASRFSVPSHPPLEQVLVITSQKDKLVNWECSKKLAERWKCPIYSHDWAGHDIALDDPRWLAESIREWVSK